MFFMTLLQDPVYFINAIVVVIVSITVHELFHALAALWQGDDTAVMAGRLTLNPMAHMGTASLVMLFMFGIAWGQTPVNESRLRHSFSPAIVSFAGPFANLLLLTLSVWLIMLLQTMSSTDFIEASIDFLSIAAILNGFLFLLNMIPIPPLDGFGVLETFVPVVRRYGVSLSQYGFFILLVLFLFFGLSRILFGLARWMVWQISDLSTGIVQIL